MIGKKDPKWTGAENGNRQCTCCWREFYGSELRTCPKSGRVTCRYCCQKCNQSYKAPIGEGCRLVDEQIAAARKEKKAQGRGKR